MIEMTSYLSIVAQHSQQLNAMHDAGLVELARHPQELLQLLFAEVVQHTGVYHVGGETLRVLGEAQVRKPLGAHPSVAELGDAWEAHEIGVSVFLDGEPQLFSMQGVRHTQAHF